MVIVALTHTLRGNCSVCQLLRWSEASICPHTSLLGVSGLFVLPSQKDEICSTWFIFKIKQSSTKRTISPPHSDYMAERNPAPFPAAHQRSNAAVVSSCACRWQLAPHNLLGSLISPHLNIYECCWTATFHYQGDCLAWGSQSFHPAHVCLGALHFIQLQSVFHRAWLPPVLLVLLRKMRG